MRTVGKIIGTALVGPVLLLCVFSCVGEDQSDCSHAAPRPLTVMLIMAPGEADPMPTPEDLKLAVVYLFDGEGSLFATWTKQNPALNTPYDTGMVLGDGNYQIVVWVNPVAPYSITPSYTTRSDLSDSRIELTIPPDGNVTGTIPMLLYGSADRVSTSETDLPVDIPLTLNTDLLHVTMKGMPQDGRTYTLNVSDNDAAMDFNNNALTAPGFVYVSDSVAPDESGNVALSQNVLHLDDSRSPQLSIVDSGENTVFPSDGTPSVDLMNLIKQAGLDPDETDLFHIEIEPPQPGESIMTIYINGWKVVLNGYIVY